MKIAFSKILKNNTIYKYIHMNKNLQSNKMKKLISVKSKNYRIDN